MMKPSDNETLTCTGDGTPMGALFRRYWLPALTTNELPYPDCPPVRLPILGQKLLAFRNSEGRVGIVDEACPHRQASLYFGRSEQCGIRCAYHGWHFDIEGRCLDIPSEGTDSKIKARIKLKSYPAIERGGVIWTYLGDGESPPPPALEWALLSEENLFVSRRLQECNYFQVMEGGLDSSHLSWLHQGSLIDDPIMGMSGLGKDSRIIEIMAADRSPRFQTIATDGGLLLGARRHAGEGRYYWRITQFVLPCFNLIAPFGDLSLNAQAWVPMDDYNCWSWAVNYYRDKPLSEQERDYMRQGGGLHVKFVAGTHHGAANRDNDYLRDIGRQQRGESFTGIPSFAMQDTAVQESQGPISDRSREQLVSSDYGIVRTRKALLEAVAANLEGITPPGLEPSAQNVKAVSIITPQENLEDVSLEAFEWESAN